MITNNLPRIHSHKCPCPQCREMNKEQIRIVLPMFRKLGLRPLLEVMDLRLHSKQGF